MIHGRNGDPMRHNLIAFALLLSACCLHVEPAKPCTSPMSAKDQQVACDGIEQCVAYETTQDPYRPEACMTGCDSDAAECRRWALEATLCHFLVERCTCQR
jgi:hypothetical protein